MKTTLITLLLLASIAGLAQKNGQYLPSGHPADGLWEFDGNKDNAAPIVSDMAQQFFFLIPEGSENSMMAPFSMDGKGFACPTKFKVSVEGEYLYLEIGESCQVDLPEEEKYIQLKYERIGDLLVLTIDGIEYPYREWGTESTRPPAPPPFKMSIDSEKARALLQSGPWLSADETLFKDFVSCHIKGRDENGWDVIVMKNRGDGADVEVRAEGYDADNYYLMEVFEEDQDKLCKSIYVYFESDTRAFFLFTNSWFPPEDNELKDQNWKEAGQ